MTDQASTSAGPRMQTSLPSRPWLRLLVGVFIVWQLIYLVLSNVLSLQPQIRHFLDKPGASPKAKRVAAVVDNLAPGWLQGEGHSTNLATGLKSVTDFWSHVSGQRQKWSMYAPKTAHCSVFPVVEFHVPAKDAPGMTSYCTSLIATSPLAAVVVAEAWQSGSWEQVYQVASENEPVDIHQFTRWGECRTNRVEIFVKIHMPYLEDRPEAVRKEVVRRLLRRVLSQNPAFVKTYLKWHMRKFAGKHPDLPPPTKVTLLQHEYRITPPEESGKTWRGPSRLSLARWRPGSDMLQVYNPWTDGFEPLK